MFDYLDKLRAKPTHVRKRIAFLSTAVLSLLVFGIWSSTWDTESTAVSKAQVTGTPSPWSVVRDTMSNAKGEMLAAFHTATNQLEYAAAESALNASSTGSEVEDQSADGVPIDSDDTISPPLSTSPSNISTEPLHTRPKLLEKSTTGTVTKNNVVQ